MCVCVCAIVGERTFVSTHLQMNFISGIYREINKDSIVWDKYSKWAGGGALGVDTSFQSLLNTVDSQSIPPVP